MTAAILVLGAPRSGTSCLAGMLAAGGARVPGPVVRNWDNARGHFEATAAVRLSEAVLTRSGGSWLKAPVNPLWDPALASERDHLLAPIAGRPALIKDPRILLCGTFWTAATPPPLTIGVVRHPLAVARSMAAWRRMPIEDGLRLWLEHASPLLLAAQHGTPLIDFDQDADDFIREVQQLAPRLWSGFDTNAMPTHYDSSQVHHDGDDAADGALRAQAETLHRELLTHCAWRTQTNLEQRAPRFPWDTLESIRAMCAHHDVHGAVTVARATAATCADPAALIIPVAAELLRANAPLAVLDLLSTFPSLDPAISSLLNGKALLAAGRAAEAVAALECACAVASPYWESRSLLAHALHESGRRQDALHLLLTIAGDAIYPHQPLATAAEWTWQEHDMPAALELFSRAIAAAPERRRGRLRCRRAELLRELGEHNAALGELELAIIEDPTHTRSAQLRERWAATTIRMEPLGE